MIPSTVRAGNPRASLASLGLNSGALRVCARKESCYPVFDGRLNTVTSGVEHWVWAGDPAGLLARPADTVLDKPTTSIDRIIVN